MEQFFRILDAGIHVTGPDSLLLPIDTAYARFRAAEASAPRTVRLELVPDPGGAVVVDGRRIPLVSGLDPTLQLYQQFLTSLMQTVGSHAVLHAAALTAPASGGAVLVAGPAGHGKSSLTLALAERGFGFLGDDYAPLDLQARTVQPYPRAVALIPSGSAPIPDVFLRSARDPATVRLFGKSLVDVGAVLGEAAVRTEPAPLRHVLLLSSEAALAAPQSTLLDVAVLRETADDHERALGEIGGVEVLERADAGHLTHWRLRLRHDRRPTEALSRLLDRDDVVLCEKHWGGRPSFDVAPRARRLKRREAAEFLGRELLNRRGGGRFLDRYQGSIPAMFLDLAAALREADCYRIVTGRYRETVELIESLVLAHPDGLA